MKYSKTIMAVSMVALMATGTAFAENTTTSTMSKDYRATTPANATQSKADAHIQADDARLTRDVKKGLDGADHSMRHTADDIRAFFVDEKGNTLSPVTIQRDLTASGMIGNDVLNPQGERIAEVEDIILDKNGNASKVIVSDGGFLGMGEKLAAFDFNRVVKKDKDGRVTMNLSQDMIDNSAEFSYDRQKMSTNSISVNALTSGDVYNDQNKKVATIENLYIDNGKASRVLVKFDQTFGMGGELAALDHGSLNFFKDGGDVNVKLSEGQSRQFVNMKKVSKK